MLPPSLCKDLAVICQVITCVMQHGAQPSLIYLGHANKAELTTVLARAGKIVRLRQKLVDAADTVKGLFGVKKEQDSAVQRLERLQVRAGSASCHIAVYVLRSICASITCPNTECTVTYCVENT